MEATGPSLADLLFMELIIQLDSVVPSLSAVHWVPGIMQVEEVMWQVGRSVDLEDQSLWVQISAVHLLP